MPIQLEFLHEGLGVIYRCEGALGLQHFSDANSRLLSSPDRIRKLKYVLVNAASMEPTFFSPSEMDGIVLQDRQIASYAVAGLLVKVIPSAKVRVIDRRLRVCLRFISPQQNLSELVLRGFR